MLQFEYEVDNWVYVPEKPESYELVFANRPRKVFLTVIEEFTHHYSGKKMCKIRQEFDGVDTCPQVEELVVEYDAVLELYEKSKEA